MNFNGIALAAAGLGMYMGASVMGLVPSFKVPNIASDNLLATTTIKQQTPQTKTCTVTHLLNIRGGQSVTSPVLGTYPEGTTVSVVVKGKWSLDSKSNGWLSTNYLRCS